MTQFRVLPVREGDAYLLKSRRGSYLVDGGGHGCGLPELLRERKVRKLRAAVCSSARPEKIGGILDLIGAGLDVSEFWFPDRVGALPEQARRFNGDLQEWRRVAVGGSEPGPVFEWPGFGEPINEEERWLHGSAALLLLGLSALPLNGFSPVRNMEGLFGSIFHSLSSLGVSRWRGVDDVGFRVFRDIGLRLLSGGGVDALAFFCGRLLLAEADAARLGECRANTVRGLACAAMAAAVISRLNGKLRFFHRTDRLEEELVPRHPMRCLNGIETEPLEGIAGTVVPSDLLRDAGRFSGVREGLVFQYGDADCGALMCGDGKMRFLGRSDLLRLDRPTVITAPCRGSVVADRAYPYIRSLDPTRDVWVRGALSSGLKISSYYKRRLDAACLKNCKTLTLQEILLEFSGGRWKTLAGACNSR
ncbi:hypothetical protein [uncultured Pseudodesulfovibrio sp.]|uniref:hypothetical protein n=1 Tax=uncultured Pseudodesulfovibrio sp. TaxID=2035858 RepID=UPI0029C86150|nr:hypothetical protein [uncultured Pseudodesulfovibrio sp.]